MKPVRAPNGMRMGRFLDSIERNTEGEKYIDATFLITLIGFITDKSVKAVAHYLRESDFSQKVSSYYYLIGKKSYSKDMHKEAHGFDLNTKELLAECYHSFGFSDKYMTFKQVHELDFDFCYLKDELQTIDCIKDLNIDFSLCFEAERAQDKWDDEIEKPIFRLADSVNLNNPENELKGLGTKNTFRNGLIKHDAYSVVTAACLLSGDAPTEIQQFKDHLEFVQVFSEYLSFKLMIELAIKNNELLINDDKILAADLKEYLGKNGYFFKGFNDFMAIEPAQPLINNKQIEVDSSNLTTTQEQAATPAISVTSNHESEQRIAELEKQLKQAHADNDLLRKKLDSNKEIQPNSQAAVARLLNVLFYKADYDITAHQGTTNTKIQKLSKEMGTPVGEKFISKWIKIVNSEKMGDEG